MSYKEYQLRMIRIIPKYPQSIHRSKVFEKIYTELREEGIEIPAKLEETIQSAYNQYCEGYSAFRKMPPGTKALFKSKNKKDGNWSVHPEYKMFSLDDF